MTKMIVLQVFTTILCVFGAGASLPVTVKPRSSLCVKNNSSCSTDGTCFMTYYPLNSTACSKFTFEGHETQFSKLVLGHVDLETYLYQDRNLYFQTAFNISFTNIQWERMKFRIMKNGNSGRNTCREFMRSANSSVESLVYDCLWSDERYEGKSFVLEYEAQSGNTIETSQVLFNVPLASSLHKDVPKDKSTVFAYVETIPTHLGRTIFNVMWRPLPQEKEVRCYRVFVIYNDTGYDTVRHSSEICQCLPNVCLYSSEMWYGGIRFGIQPLFEDGLEGEVTKTPYFDLGVDTARPLLLGVVTISILGPIALYLLLLLRNYVVRRGTRNTNSKVLLIYSPTTSDHLKFVEAFARYLSSHCNVEAWMDELEIPRSPSKDPFLWCAEAIKSADVICVVASPFFSRLRSKAALYRTDRLLLRLLREQYSSRGKTRYCVLVPPYTSENDIPVEAKSLKRINVPGNLDVLLRLTHLRWPLPGCIVSSFPGGQQDFDRLGTLVHTSIREATQDLIENKLEYLSKAEEVTEDVAGQLIGDEGDGPSGQEQEAGKNDTNLTHSLLSGHDERRAQDQLMAEEAYSGYSGNLERLNLLGDKHELAPMIVPSSKVYDARFDINNLDL